MTARGRSGATILTRRLAVNIHSTAPGNQCDKRTMTTPFLTLQKLLPQHLLSRAVGKLAESEYQWIKSSFISAFANHYGISLDEAARKNRDDYVSFNDFFTRELAEGVRPLPTSETAIACPVDGTISQCGRIEADSLIQAKGHRYQLADLAPNVHEGFAGGSFCTIYLAPNDYHRIHLPFSGELTQTVAVPGELFSVNGITEANINGLFCRNERLVCRFETTFGPMLVILVGALIVASIATVWPGPTSPYQHLTTSQHDHSMQRGDEIGRFLLGSTVICCFPAKRVTLEAGLATGQKVKVGTPLAEANPVL